MLCGGKLGHYFSDSKAGNSRWETRRGGRRGLREKEKGEEKREGRDGGKERKKGKKKLGDRCGV